MTQHNQILDILKQCGKAGMNSWQYRPKFIQLPVRIMELKKRGYEIVSIKNKDTSVNYILLGSPKPVIVEVKPKTRIETYHDDQGYEHIREILDIPIQQNLI